MEPARDPFEELTSLYLGEPIVSPKTVPSTPPPARRPRIEPMRITVAVCGNLPVMAGIWVTQYADLEAARSGPTALVRLDGGRCSFELLRTDRDPVRFDGEVMPKAAASLVGDIRRWIVCVDDRDAAAAVRAGADELVVLTSADQLALVEAYRLIKSARARAAEPDTLELGVVIAGANEQAADRAESILSDMSSRHLGAPLPVIALVRRLDVVEQSLRVAFEESLRGDPSEVVSALRAAAEAEAEMTTESVFDVARTPDAEVEEPTLRLHFPEHELDADLDGLLDGLDLEDRDLDMEVDPDLNEFDAVFADEAEPPAPPAPPARAPRSVDRDRQRPRTSSQIRLGPSPSQASGRPAFIDLDELARMGDEAASRIGPVRGQAPEAPETLVADVPSAQVVEAKPIDADLISAVAGLTAIDWPFVQAEQVHAAVDVDGRLHLVCNDRDHGQLDIARQWAMVQARQLSKCAGISAEAVRAPVLHVVTEHAPRVANLHRTGIHLHLIVDAAGGRVTVPLNDDGNREMR
jgi:hypothetical protein